MKPMPPIVSPEEWQATQERMLVKEKQMTRARRPGRGTRPPANGAHKDYVFDGAHGKARLLDLFEGRRRHDEHATDAPGH